MRSSVVHLFAIFSVCSLVMTFSHDANACDVSEDAAVSFAIRTVGADTPTDDVTVHYHIVPYASSGDDGALDPCDEDPTDPACDEGTDPDPCDEDPTDPACDEGTDPDPCDEDPTDPACDENIEPVTGSLTVKLDDAETFALPAGEGDFEFELPGYETTVIHRSICGETTIRVTLMSDVSASFSAHVRRWDGKTLAEGTQIILRGQNERLGETFEGAVDAEGQVQIDDVPAGVYALEAWLPLGNAHELLELEGIDIFQDAHLSIRLRSSADRPSYRITCASIGEGVWGQSGGAWMLWMMVMGALVALRTRRDEH